MCGIFSYKGIKHSKEELLDSIDLIKYRGPDNSQYQRINVDIFFAFHRLSIIGINKSGNQLSLMMNIDTDMIIPKQFLKTIKRSGLGKNLFDEMRYDSNGNEIDTFILNKEPFRDAKILIAGKNFGCGSSREHAPWSILDFGIKVIIAPSFADIFFNNSFKNGILPIKMDEDIINSIIDESIHKGTSTSA